MSNGNQLDQLPLDPARAARLSGLNPLPMPSPVQTPPAQQAPQGLLQQGQEQLALTQQQVADQLSRAHDIAGQIEPLVRQRAALIGHTGYSPNFEPVTGPISFLKDLGRALLTFGAATGPGQAVQSVVYSGPRAQYGALGKQIEELQKQQELEEAPMRPLGLAGGQAARGFAALSQADVSRINAETRARAEQHTNEIKQRMATVAEKGLPIKEQVNRLREAFLENERWWQHEQVRLADMARTQHWDEVFYNSQVQMAMDKYNQNSELVRAHPNYALIGATPEIPPMQSPTPPTPPSGQGVPHPPDYIYKKNGPKGAGWYPPGI